MVVTAYRQHSSQDLRVLIEYVDVNGAGELFFQDFVELIKQMRPRMGSVGETCVLQGNGGNLNQPSQCSFGNPLLNQKEMA